MNQKVSSAVFLEWKAERNAADGLFPDLEDEDSQKAPDARLERQEE
ncbi:hypothetical protein KI809_16290 [Geobacter pelophilus]|uniref:Uncharacterized protein n=1 Tax=Geoanaerobacter pelophilus TaxID=60036 RepID=A0AAW4LBU9_9BACT|nr:hypothetical protein [Geoanaerobacter pelophilus]MBT0665871.1 hypothetical protein [Geoanaerobacter pelophilus]